MSLTAVGRVDRDRQLVTVVGDAQPKTLADIREMPVITTPNGGVIPLRSVAEVVEGAEDRTVRIGGPAAATELNRGDIMVRLVAPGDRSRSSDEIIADLRGRIEAQMPEVRVEFVQVLQDVLNDLSGSPAPSR